MNKPLHIALVVHGWPPQSYGGVGLYVEALAKEMNKQGHMVRIFSPTSEKSSSSEEYSWGTLHKISFRSAKNWKETWIRSKDDITSSLPKLHFDVLHIHHLGQWPLSLPLWIQATIKLITLHDYAIVCSRGQLYQPQKGICSGPSAHKCSSCIRGQLVHIPQSNTITSLLASFPKTKKFIKEILRRVPKSRKTNSLMQERIDTAQHTLNHVHVLLSPSHDLMERYQKYTSTPIRHTPLPLLAPLKKTSLPDLPYRFVFASSIIPTKGIHLALKAIQQLPDAELWIAGHSFPVAGWPDYEKKIRSSINNTPNARYLGNLPHHSIPEMLKKAHCLLLPSLWPENSPIIIREALSMGLEVICAQQGGSKELSEQIHTVTNNSISSLTQTMQRVMKTPKRNPPIDFPSMKEHVAYLSSLYVPSKF